MEATSATLLTFGVILLLASWVQLLIVSFKEDYTWGLATIFLPPLSYFYSLFALNKAGSALGLSILGMVLIFFAL
ncbi:hypothetical protein KO528_00960 [Saccharophagus degradans]|uniref:Uncharacterized protein n=1 Tax=Saccharophagus degradans TaxID=86304 RepID=A0AAW7X3H6_9GAMM|nr:hypothetical protein [Saccharophagus degradans]MBU2983906.1 hypothetical protein [Saccharophagus degradans]MDO6422117.1 hypothetical protein [Saccharophagus degradans]MDO6609328.1 hypothetical protein [Saccharophagus degradans]WGO98026.1 hypothetical protein QFX18_18635 [Saccharophagus degradans]